MPGCGADSGAKISSSAARARARRARSIVREIFKISRRMRIVEPFQHDKQQSLPLHQRKSKERIGKFVARQGRKGRLPGGARPARAGIFLLHVSFGAQAHRCQLLTV